MPRHIHAIESPFPFLLNDGRTVIDERCRCGQLRSVHADRFIAYGHGPCPEVGCERFTWAEPIYGERITL